MGSERSDRGIEFDQALKQLRASYRRELPQRLRELEAAVGYARAEGGLGTLREAHRQAHTLKGTSGSYGLREVSRTLAVLEEALETLLGGSADPTEGWRCVDDALRRIQAALRDRPPSV